MRISLGQLRRIIREEVQREAVSNYKSGRMDVFPDYPAKRTLPSDPNNPDERDFLGHEDPELIDDEPGWDGKIPSNFGSSTATHSPTYNPDGTRNKPGRPSYVPMRRR
jgi:hypothetical protein